MSTWDGEGQKCWVDRTLDSRRSLWGRCQEVKMETEGDRYISVGKKLS